MTREERLQVYDKFYLQSYNVSLTDTIGCGVFSATKRRIENYTYKKNQHSKMYFVSQLLEVFVTQTSLDNIIVSEFDEKNAEICSVTQKIIKECTLFVLYEQFMDVELITREQYDEIKNKNEYDRTLNEVQ
jgi:hypothetical protein